MEIQLPFSADFNPSASRVLDEAISRALRKDPRERFVDAREARKELLEAYKSVSPAAEE
mgnify:CR=1 FL=1